MQETRTIVYGCRGLLTFATLSGQHLVDRVFTLRAEGYLVEYLPENLTSKDVQRWRLMAGLDS